MQEVKPVVEQFLKERGLELSSEKTVVTHIENGFDFLGQNVRKYNGKLLIKPSKKSLLSFLRKVRAIIKAMRGAPAWQLVVKLNPVIRGWANYHRHVVSSKVFSSVDSAIFHALWRWAKRRHPKKGARWVRRKYFLTVGTNHWIFSGTMPSASGPKAVHLFKARSMRIQRHVKVLGTVNPYDPRWAPYLAQRHRHGSPSRSNVLPRWSNERHWRLEPYDGKLSRTVLRGGNGGNAVPLPGSRTHHPISRIGYMGGLAIQVRLGWTRELPRFAHYSFSTCNALRPRRVRWMHFPNPSPSVTAFVRN